jgi:hypothetical protein
MVFNATFNNISVILWQSVLLVEETGMYKCIKSFVYNITFLLYPDINCLGTKNKKINSIYTCIQKCHFNLHSTICILKQTPRETLLGSQFYW